MEKKERGPCLLWLGSVLFFNGILRERERESFSVFASLSFIFIFYINFFLILITICFLFSPYIQGVNGFLLLFNNLALLCFFFFFDSKDKDFDTSETSRFLL
ncbi:hypothetical protein QUC31_020337 [Theobroma cacao]